MTAVYLVFVQAATIIASLVFVFSKVERSNRRVENENTLTCVRVCLGGPIHD